GGIKRGDVITSFNGQTVRDTNSLRNRVADAGPGSTADVVVIRDGAEKHLSVKLEALSDRTARSERDGNGDERSADKGALGMPAAPDAKGLIVEDVAPDGRAAAAGIRRGDMIKEVNRQAVKSIDELRTAVRKSSDRPALLLINRDGSDVFVTVKPANG